MKRTSLLLALMLVVVHAPTRAHAKPASGPPARARVAATANAKVGAQVGATVGKAKPCYAKPVQLLRVRGVQVEPREVSLTLCNGAPNPAALDSVSVLARPRDVERPLLPEIRAYRARPAQPRAAGGKNAKAAAKNKQKYRHPMFVTEQVMRVHPGLLQRLQKIAKHYPGKVIEIISGYRPDSRETSRHHHGHALDLRVAGITREKLRDYVRSFEETGVGYYPNSYFVHMDVREAKGYWVDRSGPGEPADYGPWPPANKRDTDRARDSVLKGALADLAELGKPVVRSANDRRTAMAGHAVPLRSAPIKNRVGEPDQQERDDMQPDEVARVREEARRALEEL